MQTVWKPRVVSVHETLATFEAYKIMLLPVTRPTLKFRPDPRHFIGVLKFYKLKIQEASNDLIKKKKFK
jgi:hypothetical protein